MSHRFVRGKDFVRKYLLLLKFIFKQTQLWFLIISRCIEPCIESNYTTNSNATQLPSNEFCKVIYRVLAALASSSFFLLLFLLPLP